MLFTIITTSSTTLLCLPMFAPSTVPDSAIALQDSSLELTYGQLKKLTTTLPPRSVVLLVAPTTTAAAASILTCLREQVVAIHCSNKNSAAVLAQLAHNYQVDAIISPEEVLTELKKICTFTQTLTLVGDFTVAKLPEHPQVPVYEHLALLLPTSGSTGSSKYVRISYENLTLHAATLADYLHLTPQERPLLSLPLFYSYGVSILLSHIHVGATVVLTSSSVMQAEYWHFLKDKDITSISGVPYSYAMLLRLGFTRQTYPHLTAMTQSGSHLPASQQQTLATYAKEHGIRFYVMYGQTEATSRISYLEPDLAAIKLGSTGKAIALGELYLVNDKQERITTPHEEGELIYKGTNVALGYACKAEDLALGDEWQGVLHTGDVAYCDEDGYFFITGRLKRFIKLTGQRTSLTSVEDILSQQYPQLLLAAGGSDDHLKVYITKDSLQESGVTTSDVLMFLHHRLSVHPSLMEVKAIEHMPLNDNSKICYKKLEEL